MMTFTITPRAMLLSVTASVLLAGLVVARLTLGLNPHLHASLGDTAMVLFWFALASVIGGICLGIPAALLASRWPRALPSIVPAALLANLVMGPLVYVLALPDLGLAGRALTDLISATWPKRIFILALVAVVLSGFGVGLSAAVRRLAERLKLSPWRLAFGGWAAVVGMLIFVTLVVRPQPEASPVAGEEEVGSTLSVDGGPPPSPVVLLCVDGLDLDALQPWIDAGDLPTFARLQRDGTWGPLATLEPTLSAVVWTTLATGKPAEEHGIHHFLHFQLPGVERGIDVFPLHTGLNFQILPRLEKLFGLRLRRPYTGNMRRAAALWEIAQARGPVGVYRWLVTWPAEEVEGFSVSGGLGWAQLSREEIEALKREHRGRAAYPPDLFEGLPRPSREISDADLRAYVKEGVEIDRRSARWRPVLEGLRDPTAHDLPLLIERYGARFTAAAFFSVDVFHHLYNADLREDGPFAPAIAERYRLTDTRLGELLEALGPEVNVLVVSDHGYDFEHDHHTWAPPGAFFGLGPAFSPGRRAEGLSVYDIAPMALHLLGLPLAQDMRGTQSSVYREAIAPEFLAAHPVSRVESWGAGGEVGYTNVESPKDEELREVLESLGYIQ